MANISLAVETTETHVNVSVKFPTLEPVEHSFEIAKMPQATLLAALRIGFTNMVRDSWAGDASDEVEARDAAVNKVDRLIAGDIKAGSRGPRLSEEERIVQELQDKVIRANLKNGAKMPVKDALKAAREAVMQNAKMRAYIEKETKRQLKENKELRALAEALGE